MSEDNNTLTDAKTTETDAPAAASVEVDLLDLSKNIANINTNQVAMCKVLTDMSQRLDNIEQQKNKIKIVSTPTTKQLTKQEREAKEHADFFRI